MAIISFISKLLSAWFAFALPLFRSFQALHHRPASDPAVERWLKYWVVIAGLVIYEYTVEFLISWFPFYWEFKTLFLLYLSLPQTQGSTFLYDTFLAPFLVPNEAELDRQISDARENIFSFFQNNVQTVLDKALGKKGAPAPNGSPESLIQDAARVSMGFLTAHGTSIAGKNGAVNVQPTTDSADKSAEPGSDLPYL